jgi:ABC-type multidrug transport system fused ATPase/permease subunit
MMELQSSVEKLLNRKNTGQVSVARKLEWLMHYREREQCCSCLYADVIMPLLFCSQATGQRVGIVLQSVATIGLGVGLALYYEWRLGLVTMCFTPVILVAQFLFLKTVRGEAFNNQKALEKSTKVSKVEGSVKSRWIMLDAVV